MAENSAIEWTDHTFNPWIGCQKVSPACDHCYAETLATGRMGREWGPKADRRRTKTWGDPVRWNRRAEAEGRRYRVFCASLADVFDNHKSIEASWRRELWSLIEATPNLDWLLLTKRPQNIARYLPSSWGVDGYPNVWLGTTVENQAEANRRIPLLLAAPARIRFLSCEPLLGPVDLTSIRFKGPRGGLEDWDALDLHLEYADDPELDCGATLDWIIAGGESGAKSRPTKPQWFRDLRDQCATAGVPFLFKQWGDWVSVSEVEGPGRHFKFEDGATVRRIGKKKAGRTLDGVVHDGYPVSQ